MSGQMIFVNIMRTLAMVAFFVQQFYFVPFGAASGIVTGLVLYAIWSPWFKEAK